MELVKTEKRTRHPYWVYETIMSCGDVLRSWHQEKQQRKIEEIAEAIVQRRPTHVFLAGTGSSHLAALAQSHALHQIADIPASAWVASELKGYPPPHFDRRALLMLNTHTGKSPLDVMLVEQSRDRGVYTIGVTDIEDSPFARACDSLLIGQDGPKKELPSTRTYSSAMYRTMLVAVACARRTGSPDSLREYQGPLGAIPGTVDAFLKGFDSRAKSTVAALGDSTAYFVVSSGPNMATAHEGAMGLTQGTGRPAAGYNVDEYMHGPVQSLGKGHCVVAIAPPGPFQAKIGGFARAARRIGAKVVMIAPEGSGALEEADVTVAMPGGIPEVITPVLYCAPFWLLGYYFSLHYGRDPDNLSMDKDAFKSSGLAELKKLV
jgi:glucosamine--fructose-6-phosphate aminotransferase (isomerizing)